MKGGFCESFLGAFHGSGAGASGCMHRQQMIHGERVSGAIIFPRSFSSLFMRSGVALVIVSVEFLGPPERSTPRRAQSKDLLLRILTGSC